jgi:glycosidase
MTSTPSPADWRDGWIYFALIDRFNNPSRSPAHAWDEPWSGFQGGTLPGLTAQLGYVRDLGATAIWLSPVLQNVASDDGTYHGYGIQNFSRVEPRFCADPTRARADVAYADSQLRELVDAAHTRGLSVILDIVINHAGDVYNYDGYGSIAPWRNAPPYPIHWRNASGQPDPAWANAPDSPPADAAVHPAALRNNDAFRRLGNAFGASGHDPAAAGDFYSLKELVTTLQDGAAHYLVRNALIDCYADVIRRFDVDGYRIDTLMYVERDFAVTFGNAMREYAQSTGKQNFFTFGEVYADEQRISAYVGRHVGEAGDLVGVDAALDFPLFYVLPQIVKAQVAPRAMVDVYALRRRLEEGVISSHGEAGRYFVTFADNHDQHARLRYEDPGDPHRYDDQVSLALAILLSLQGVPCIYYGTEAGLAGSGSAPEAVREALWGAPNAFDVARQPFAATLQELSAVRAARPELRYGRQYFRPVSGDGTSFGHSPFGGGVIAYSRILAASEVVVVANTSTAQAFTGHVLVDADLTPAGTMLAVAYSNQTGANAPGAAVDRPAGSVTVQEDGGVSSGPIRTVDVFLRPMEVQILVKP